MTEKLLYVGLDADEQSGNIDLVHQLSDSGADPSTQTEGVDFGFKLNLDHALIWGREYIETIVNADRPVFVDLKMNNGSRTMGNVVRWLGDIGVAHTNVWAQADSNLAKTVEAVAQIEDRPAILAVTSYTRWDDNYARKHHNMSSDEMVRHWSQVGVDSGADGIILPGNRLQAVAGIDTIKVNPAIRMDGVVTKSKQEQTSTPYDAIMQGSDVLVVGSPIYGAEDPVQALREHMVEMSRAVSDLAAAA
jgi:orotidine-5'-phosphate decarboxylase